MSTTEKTPGAAEFIESLKDRTFRRKVAPALRKVGDGGWDEVVKIAEAQGFTFTKHELKALVPKAFYKGEGKRPERGWSKDRD